MKVVIPVGALHVGGGCRVLADVANALVKAGHEVEIVIPYGASIAYSLLCQVTKVPALRASYIPHGDVVLVNFFTTVEPAFAAWPQACVRLSLGFEPYFVPDYAKPQAFWTYEQGIPTISISTWLDEQIYQHTHRRGMVVNLGIQPSIFFGNEKTCSVWRKTILYIARDPNVGYEVKGFYDFAASIERLKTFNIDFQVFMICPEGPLSLTETPYQVFKPVLDADMAKLYRMADVFVSTSWNEGFALPPLEAMACGTPVVTTNSGGILDFCRHNESAYIVAPQDVQGIAEGMYAVLANNNLWQRLRAGGLKSAARFSHEQFEQRIVSAICQIHHRRQSRLPAIVESKDVFEGHIPLA